MVARLSLLSLIFTAGCSHPEPRVERITIREPVRVEIPVPVGCQVAPELLAPFDEALPEFIETCAPASSGLTPENETRLQTLIANREQRLRAWRAWAESCEPPGAVEAPDH